MGGGVGVGGGAPSWNDEHGASEHGGGFGPRPHGGSNGGVGDGLWACNNGVGGGFGRLGGDCSHGGGGLNLVFGGLDRCSAGSTDGGGGGGGLAVIGNRGGGRIARRLHFLVEPSPQVLGGS